MSFASKFKVYCDYNSRKGGFMSQDGLLKYPLVAGREVSGLMFEVTRAMDDPKDPLALQRIYNELLDNYIEKNILRDVVTANELLAELEGQITQLAKQLNELDKVKERVND